MIDTKTKLYGILGHPVEHSMSPAIHNRAFKENRINAVYLAFDVTDIKNTLSGIRALNVQGLSVTIPHKIKVMEYLDEIDDIAKNIGAVNTIINENGVLKGVNSDGPGAYRAITEKGINLKDKKAIILGSGGAARAIAFTIAAKEKINELFILGVDVAEYELLANEIKDKTGRNVLSDDIGNIDKHINDAEIIINCTPLGMHPNVNATPLPEGLLKPSMCVFDIVYNPYETKLLSQAREAGCKIIHGTSMFLNQAVIQFELWTGTVAPVRIMEKVLFEKLGIDL